MCRSQGLKLRVSMSNSMYIYSILIIYFKWLKERTYFRAYYYKAKEFVCLTHLRKYFYKFVHDVITSR